MYSDKIGLYGGEKVENISIINNYRSQFDRVISSSSSKSW